MIERIFHVMLFCSIIVKAVKKLNLQIKMESKEIISTASFSFRSAMSQQRHDVFLSFRGEDTRRGLTAELHRALTNAGIATYKDDINLEKGRDIASELMMAVQASRVSVIVFSRNYATSGWCLDELVKIVECRQVDGQIVVPVFCDVGADDVSGQKGSFEVAFRRHEERFSNDKVGKWRSALTEASACSPAWALQYSSEWHRSMFIQEIVKQISCRRQDAHMFLSLQPESVNDGKETLNHLLSVVSEDVLVIGIYGADKVQKTGIAKAVYNENFLRFQGSSFLANVSSSSRQPNGLLRLQGKILSDILMTDEDVEIEDIDKGIDMIKAELRSRRVFVVLDDVDKLDQLNALARKRDWFGAGSRVIITTGDANLLSVLESDDVYGPKGIQIIKDKYRQNREMIEELEHTIQKLHFQTQTRERSLIAEIEREQMENRQQAQILAGLQQDQSPSLPTTSEDCEFDPIYLASLEAKLDMEMEKLDGFLGYEKREQNLFIEN